MATPLAVATIDWACVKLMELRSPFEVHAASARTMRLTTTMKMRAKISDAPRSSGFLPLITEIESRAIDKSVYDGGGRSIGISDDNISSCPA